MKNKLRVILAEKKLTVVDVFNDTNISRTTLYGLYHEKTKNPTVPTILKLCDYLDVTPNELLKVDEKEEI